MCGRTPRSVRYDSLSHSGPLSGPLSNLNLGLQVMTELVGQDAVPDLVCATQREQLDLLRIVLSATEARMHLPLPGKGPWCSYHDLVSVYVCVYVCVPGGQSGGRATRDRRCIARSGTAAAAGRVGAGRRRAGHPGSFVVCSCAAAADCGRTHRRRHTHLQRVYTAYVPALSPWLCMHTQRERGRQTEAPPCSVQGQCVPPG